MSEVRSGDIIVTESQTLRDSYVVCRVVKIGRVMWEVETMRKDFRDGWFFDKPSRRKVGKFKVYRGNNPEDLADSLRVIREEFWGDQKSRRERYYSDVMSLPGLLP